MPNSVFVPSLLDSEGSTFKNYCVKSTKYRPVVATMSASKFCFLKYADIRWGSLGRGRQTTVRLSTMAFSAFFGDYFVIYFRDKARIIIWGVYSPLLAFR